jgi:hypothetical protein
MFYLRHKSGLYLHKNGIGYTNKTNAMEFPSRSKAKKLRDERYDRKEYIIEGKGDEN